MSRLRAASPSRDPVVLASSAVTGTAVAPSVGMAHKQLLFRSDARAKTPSFPLTITFRDLSSSPTIEGFVRRWASKLETACDRIERCHVVIERPHQRHHHGQRYHVRVALAVPGPDIKVSRDHSLDGAHEDLHVAIRDAFRSARRQLEDHVRRQRADVQ